MALLKSLFLHLHPSWQHIFKDELQKTYLKELSSFLEEEVQQQQAIFPPEEKIFSAFNITPFSKVKVVILGQDPYHGEGQAHGLSFSVPHGTRIPPSLQNIYKEIQRDLGVQVPMHGNLQGWAQQGVLLLNATLTVRKKQPKSHYGKGWENFSNAVIEKLSASKQPVVFLLWGKSACEKKSLIDDTNNCVLTAPHPSPYSAHQGFFGCKHFSQANQWLLSHQLSPILWEDH